MAAVSEQEQEAEKINPDGSSQDDCIPVLVCGLVLVLLLAVCAYRYTRAAPPALPFSPYGTAKVNGANVADGTVVSAWCGGVSYRQTATITFSGESWYTNLDIPGDDPETPAIKEGCAPGETASFKIGDLWAVQTVAWLSGGGGRFDLSAAQPTAITVSSLTAARCWYGTVWSSRRQRNSPVGYIVLVARDTGGPSYAFWSIWNWPNGRVKVCGSVVYRISYTHGPARVAGLAAPLPGSRGGCKASNYWRDIACTVVKAGSGWAFGNCKLGYAFSGATGANLTAGQVVSVSGCLDDKGVLLDGGRNYPLRIRAAQ